MANIDLINAFLLYQSSKSSDSTNSAYTAMQAELLEKITNLNGEIAILDTQEETYNEMYLNTKDTPVKLGLFSGIGLRTTQDFVLAYFYFSYFVFFILLIITAVKQSKEKMLAALSLFCVAFVVAVFVTGLLIAYA